MRVDCKTVQLQSNLTHATNFGYMLVGGYKIRLHDYYLVIRLFILFCSVLLF